MHVHVSMMIELLLLLLLETHDSTKVGIWDSRVGVFVDALFGPCLFVVGFVVALFSFENVTVTFFWDRIQQEARTILSWAIPIKTIDSCLSTE